MRLTDFLLERVAEDERIGRDGRHICQWDPERVLVECTAKRAVVELLEILNRDGEDSIGRLLAYEIALRLVQPYRSHPEFERGWRLND